jgi:UDP-glucose:(glucosyl)LPS alpha-1,3-glucosyltransferase
MNLLYCIDKNYNDQCYTSIKSIVSNAKVPIKIFVVHSEPASFSKEFVIKSSDNKVKQIEVIKFNEKLISNKSKLPTNSKVPHVTLPTFFRLFIEELIPESLNEILYLDADVICMKNFEQEYHKLFHSMKKEKYVVGARTIGDAKGNAEMFERLDLKSKKYFNAGVMFIDIAEWRRNNVGKALNNLLYKGTYTYMDQDILNKHFDGNYYEIDTYMNYLIKVTETNEVQPIVDKFVKDHAKLIHYVGTDKPWHEQYADSKNSSYYQNYYSSINMNSKHIIKKPINRYRLWYSKVLRKFNLKY